MAVAAESTWWDDPEASNDSFYLSDVDHLIAGRIGERCYDPSVLEAVLVDRITAVEEAAMPYRVSETVQWTDYRYDQARRKQRVFMWLGKTALDVAMSGRTFYVGDAAMLRNDIEIKEAVHNQETLQPGRTQVFISPRMSGSDGSEQEAKANHVYHDDAIRTATAIVDYRGNVIGCLRKSLLVRDVPLEAWVAMLRDPDNLFGRPIDVRDEHSALSVMEQFAEMELPDELLPNGPVTIVEAVSKYIKDPTTRLSVEYQAAQYMQNQDTYKRVAEARARQWLDFDIELTESLHNEWATPKIRNFIYSLQHQWSAENLKVIESNMFDSEIYMTRRLAGILEKAKANLLTGISAIETGNESVLQQIGLESSENLRQQIEFIDTLRSAGVSESELMAVEAQLYRNVASENISTEGGCMGENRSAFDSPDFRESNDAEGAAQTESVDRASWKWKSGVCRVPRCPSPKPTEVGPCKVCRGCQDAFDRGDDPTVVVRSPESEKTVTGHIDEYLQSLSTLFEAQVALASVDQDEQSHAGESDDKMPTRLLRPRQLAIPTPTA